MAISIGQHRADAPALSAFGRRYPDALVKVSETLFHPVEQDVCDGRIDLYVGAFEPAGLSPRLVYETLFENKRLSVWSRNLVGGV